VHLPGPPLPPRGAPVLPPMRGAVADATCDGMRQALAKGKSEGGHVCGLPPGELRQNTQRGNVTCYFGIVYSAAAPPIGPSTMIFTALPTTEE
jgi:hypothetical protein